MNVSKNQVRFEFGKSTLRPDDNGECRTTAAQSTFVAKSVVGTIGRDFLYVDLERKDNFMDVKLHFLTAKTCNFMDTQLQLKLRKMIRQKHRNLKKSSKLVFLFQSIARRV